MLFSMVITIVALCGATVYLIKDTSASKATNEQFLTTKGVKEPLGTAAVKTFTTINSEMTLEQIDGVESVSMKFDATNEYLSLNVNGYLWEPCNATAFACNSEHSLFFYTSECIVVYDGDSAAILSP